MNAAVSSHSTFSASRPFFAAQKLGGHDRDAVRHLDART